MGVCGRPLPVEDRERILRLRARNVSIRNIAKDVRCSTRTVQKLIRTHCDKRATS